MARPKNKTELIEASTTEFARLWQLIDSIPEDAQQAEFTFDITGKKEAHWSRDKNLRDVLVHLYEWHQLILKWVPTNLQGDAQPFLPAPYNWKTYGEMNVEFWKQHQCTSYEEAKLLLKESHSQVMALAETFTNEELFTKKHFSWTGTSNLGSYFISSTSSHYDWACKKVKLHLKSLA